MQPSAATRPGFERDVDRMHAPCRKPITAHMSTHTHHHPSNAQRAGCGVLVCQGATRRSCVPLRDVGIPPLRPFTRRPEWPRVWWGPAGAESRSAHRAAAMSGTVKFPPRAAQDDAAGYAQAVRAGHGAGSGASRGSHPAANTVPSSRCSGLGAIAGWRRAHAAPPSSPARRTTQRTRTTRNVAGPRHARRERHHRGWGPRPLRHDDRRPGTARPRLLPDRRARTSRWSTVERESRRGQQMPSAMGRPTDRSAAECHRVPVSLPAVSPG